ncbi:hypothetical protein [Paraclostridium bifermentans]|uniref:hypothetical protein n=1 Tax=Paraclostridium bifermentans TaxID=1490 RepID=UPI00359C850F
MALEQRFATIDKAILVATGNSLVVCGSTTEPSVNTSDLIMINGNTTRDWNECGSTATLNILDNSTILYAEIVWYSTVYSNVVGAPDLRSIQDSSITLTTSKGDYEITPEYTQSYNAESGTIDRYRAAEVTDYVKDSLSGSYSVSEVPISIPSTGLSNSRGGWTLTVIYRNDTFKPQKIIYNSGISVATPNTSLQTTISGFTTSSDILDFNGSVCMSCANGGPLNGEEIVLVGPSFAKLTNIGNTVNSPNPNPGNAPNNPGNSFFSGIINTANPLSDNNGLLNINGTNGTNNNDGFVPTQLVGARNKWDITNVDITNTLVPNQTLLAGQITEGEFGDGVQLVALGVQVSSKAPNITAKLDAFDIDGDSEYNIEVGEALIYSLQIKNEGALEANNVIVSANLDSSTSFIKGSLKINGVEYQGLDITQGINLGTIGVRGIKNILFAVKANSVPEAGVVNQDVNYSYQFASGIDNITNSAKTNKIAVIVQDGKLAITKTASKSNISLNENVTYTIDIENIGTETAKKLFLQDKITESCSFVNGSVFIDGEPYSDYNPKFGFSLPDLNVGDSIQVVFECRVDSLPQSRKVNNICYITFEYILDQYGYSREKTAISNSTSIQVQYVDIVGERCNNNNYPNIGEIVTYTLELTNIGNVDAKNIQVQEPTIPGTTVVEDSVRINGVLQDGLNPFTGFTLPQPIESMQTTSVEYQVLVDSINPDNLIENTAQVPFKYEIVAGGNVTEDEKISNTVDTIANFVCMNIIKTVDKSHAEIGDTLYYKIDVSNSGNINATNTLFTDIIQQEASFVAGTVAINGISYPNYNPNLGFTLDIICPSDTVEVTFQAKVQSVPNPNIITNQGSLLYGYKPDPNGSTLTNTIYTNEVETIINKAEYSIVKSVDKNYAQIGDPLVYTTTIQNIGTVMLENIKFADFVGKYLAYYPQTVYIDGVHNLELNPNNKFSITNMNPGDTVNIVFAVTVTDNPEIGYITNTSEVTLSYKITPNSPIMTETVYSNEVVTYVPYAQIDLVKSVDKAYATIGDTLTYSFIATNIGNSAAIDTLFSDIIQSEAEFVPGSVKVNGVTRADFNPETGFTLGKMEQGQGVTVEFKAKVNSLPNPNTILNNATTSYSYHIDPDQQKVTKTVTSNTVSTIINDYSATVTKSVDKLYALVGDTLNYTVVVNNTGTVTLKEVNLLDIIQSEASFIVGSVFIDGENYEDYDPNTGFIINDVLPSGNVVVMFKVKIDSLPNPSQINNSADVNLKYQLSPTGPTLEDSLKSNTVTTNVSETVVTNTKSVDKVYATIGDVLTYTSVIYNDGNTDLENTNFIDNTPNHTTFVAGTVKINGTSYENYNPNNGFELGIISPQTSRTVTFDVTVDSLPNDGYVQNTSILNHQFKIEENGDYISGSVTSNNVVTYINFGDLNITKTANRTIAKLNDIINYSFVISNIGNTQLQNVLFTDVIQVESTFSEGSVFINGENRPTYDPNTGFSIGTIPIGQQATVSFDVLVDAIPADNNLLNKADVTYSYYVDPEQTPITYKKESNTTTVEVFDTIISTNKSVDKAIAQIGDTLSFTIDITNNGNVAAQNISFTDLLDENIEFIANSVYVNNIQQPEFNPNIGFDLEDIDADSTTTVTFAATINTRPADNIIYNFATIDYSYVVDTETIEATINTNTTQTYVAIGELTVTKSVDKDYARVSETIAYTIVVRNTGSVDAINLNVQDLIQQEASFNSGTVVVNGETKPLYDPNIGFELDDLTPNQFHTVTFNVSVDSLPESEEIVNSAEVLFEYKLTPSDEPIPETATSNEVNTLIKIGDLEATKVVDKAYATIGDTLKYTITVNNLGNADCIDVFFKDTIQSHASFITGTVKLNGQSKPTYNPNVGFNIDNIGGYTSSTVTFDVRVEQQPIDYIIYNSAIVDYKYYIDPDNQPIVEKSFTNTVQTTINIGSLAVNKSVSKDYATIDDAITYTVNILNNGNVTAKNVNFRDVIPTGVTFKTGSVRINGKSYPSYNPYSSFTLGNILSGDSVEVTFDVKVTSLPNPSLINNTANVTFAYRIDPNSSDIIEQIDSNTVTTQINVGSIELNKNVDKAYATLNDTLIYAVKITNTGNVSAGNIIFTDSLQEDIAFVEGSVKIGEDEYLDYDPEDGFNIGDLQPLDSIEVSFEVTVLESSLSPSVLNYGVGTFDYKIDPEGQYYSKSNQSNTVSTIIRRAVLTTTKTVNKAYATLQDNLNYSVLVKNDGNAALFNLSFVDFLSDGAVFKAGTVVIDGEEYGDYNPIDGFNLPNNLLPGLTSLIQFQATVTTIPSPPQVTNYAIVAGTYQIDPEGPTYDISSTSNTVTTNINIGSLSNTKSVDKDYAKVNGTVIYTCEVTNTGNVNATNLVFTDILQTELNYVSGTVSINDVGYPSLDPTIGFALTDLSPGQTVTVRFSAKINSLPTPPYVTNTSNVQFTYKINPTGASISKDQVSNNVTTNVVLGKLTSVKTVDKAIATIGDELTYTIKLTNNGNVIDNNVFFQDIPSKGVEFKSGSVIVNNVSQPGFDPTEGFSLGDIGIGNVVTVIFTVVVVFVPETNKVTNQSVTTFEFLVDPKQAPHAATSYSNIVTTNISYSSLNVEKAVNKQYATIGEELTYTIIITNTGNIDATDVVFLDPTPQNSVFVLESVTINGVAYPDYNPSIGFNLNTMIPGQIITVVYKVKVIDLC